MKPLEMSESRASSSRSLHPSAWRMIEIWQVGKRYSPPQVNRIWGIWESYYNIPKAIVNLPKGDYSFKWPPLHCARARKASHHEAHPGGRVSP